MWLLLCKLIMKNMQIVQPSVLGEWLENWAHGKHLRDNLPRVWWEVGPQGFLYSSKQACTADICCNKRTIQMVLFTGCGYDKDYKVTLHGKTRNKVIARTSALRIWKWKWSSQLWSNWSSYKESPEKIIYTTRHSLHITGINWSHTWPASNRA